MPRGAFSILPQLVSTLPQLIHFVFDFAATCFDLAATNPRNLSDSCNGTLIVLWFRLSTWSHTPYVWGRRRSFFLMPYLTLRFWHQGSWVPCLPRIMLESFHRLITFRKTPTDLNSSDRRLAHCSGERNDGFHPWLIPTKDCTIGQLRLRVAASPFTTQRSEIEEEFIDRGFWGRAS